LRREARENVDKSMSGSSAPLGHALWRALPLFSAASKRDELLNNFQVISHVRHEFRARGKKPLGKLYLHEFCRSCSSGIGLLFFYLGFLCLRLALSW
jgi:hypothetical protein